MLKYTLKIDGMMCGMCESHINDVIRKNFIIKKVSSSHKKNNTVILSDSELDEDKLKKVINNTGYNVLNIQKDIFVKRKLFSLSK